MTKTKLFAAAAVLTSMIATPVLAKDMSDASQQPVQVKKQRMMKTSDVRQTDRRMLRDRDTDVGYDRGYGDRGYRNNTGFFPVDAAIGIAGGAVATAGAIATAPFGGSGYAYNDGYRTNNGWNRAGYNDGYNRVGYNDGYRSNYGGSYASVNNYPRVGAFATAPYTNPFELNRVGNADPFPGQTYAQRNGFVCVPGTVFTNLNGIRTLCQ